MGSLPPETSDGIRNISSGPFSINSFAISYFRRLLPETTSWIGRFPLCFFAMIALGITHGLVFLPVLLSMCGPLHSGHFSEPLEGTEDSTMKPMVESDTDESNSDEEESDKQQIAPIGVADNSSSRAIEQPLATKKSLAQSDNDSAETRGPAPCHTSVLCSQSTFRDESLEVVLRWNPDTMAWI